MDDTTYIANYNYALSYLKLNQKEAAIEALKRALSQIPSKEKHGDNVIYLSILSTLAFLVIESKDFTSVAQYVEEGLAVKENHADLLFMKSLLLLDMRRFDEVLESIVHYLLSLEEMDSERFHYKYAHEGALNEVYNNILPTACKYAFEFSRIKEITEQLCKVTQSERFKKAFEVMGKTDRVRVEGEN